MDNTSNTSNALNTLENLTALIQNASHKDRYNYLQYIKCRTKSLGKIVCQYCNADMFPSWSTYYCNNNDCKSKFSTFSTTSSKRSNENLELNLFE